MLVIPISLITFDAKNSNPTRYLFTLKSNRQVSDVINPDSFNLRKQRMAVSLIENELILTFAGPV